MNIDDYRAMIAQEKAQQTSPTNEGETTDAQTQPSATEPNVQGDNQTQQTEPPSPNAEGEGNSQTPPSEPTPPQTIVIEGIGEVPLDEVTKGYLRQSDYTRKTQELATQRKQVEDAVQFYQKLKENPELSQQLATQYEIPNLDPATSQMQELEAKYHDLLLEREVERLQTKYTDFDVREVLQTAYDKKLENLEDAYLITRANKPQEAPTTPQLDIEQVKEQLRQELKQELELELGTRSIIQSGGAPPQVSETPKLSEAQLKVARAMRLSPEEYFKWQNQK